MEMLVNLHIERLPEGMYLATSDEVQGLIAQGRTLQETLEIARDVARKLLEAQSERQGTMPLRTIGESFDYPLVVGR
jgi:predicted RNase H-like HicB family nuclease